MAAAAAAAVSIKQQRLLIETPFTKLEALAFSAPARRGCAAVILHPYALLGGSMGDPMVSELFRAAASSPAFSFVLRYNQRGVGRSAGRMNLRGQQDMVDVLDVVEFAAAQLPGPEKQVVVIGYSWGCCLAAHALAHPSVCAYVGVSFPLGGLSWVLQTGRHFGEVARASHVPRLLVLGDQDQFTKLTAMQQSVAAGGGCLLRQDDSFQPEADAAATSAAGASSASGVERKPLLLRVFPDSDHFWLSQGSLAAGYAVGWLEALLLQGGSGGQAAAHAASSTAEEAAAPPSAAAQGVSGGDSAANEGSLGGPAAVAGSAAVEAAAVVEGATDLSAVAGPAAAPAAGLEGPEGPAEGATLIQGALIEPETAARPAADATAAVFSQQGSG